MTRSSNHCTKHLLRQSITLCPSAGQPVAQTLPVTDCVKASEAIYNFNSNLTTLHSIIGGVLVRP